MPRETAIGVAKSFGATHSKAQQNGGPRKQTTHLVVGTEVSTNKLAKAAKFGAAVVDEAGFIQLIRTRAPGTLPPLQPTVPALSPSVTSKLHQDSLAKSLADRQRKGVGGKDHTDPGEVAQLQIVLEAVSEASSFLALISKLEVWPLFGSVASVS
jgi:hypothetical protein